MVYPFAADKLGEIKRKVLYSLGSYNTFSFLDNNQYHNAPNRFELLVGVGCTTAVALAELEQYKGQWLFGHLNYDLKNTIFPRLDSRNPCYINFKESGFYIPEYVLAIPYEKNELQIFADDQDEAKKILDAVLQVTAGDASADPVVRIDPLSWISDFEKQAYIDTVQQLQNHIVEGDCYEINLCNGHHAKVDFLNPVALFELLNRHNPAPFSGLYRRGAQYLISSSPERYLYKDDKRIVSQPIKGTIGRAADAQEDELLKQKLLNDLKERAENVMITDLVRNDLARLSEVGSITVPELMGVYTFESLHHLISTVSGRLKEGMDVATILTTPFPMGSMTGAPKYIVMELIEQYENSQRGIYAGTLGYITPQQDFDFNVIIRSLVYDAATAQLSFHTGGAITIDSDAEKEWEETRLKAQRLKQVLSETYTES